jgi:Ni/Co efflux regulator RcnB
MAEKGGQGKDDRADKGNSNQGARHDERAEQGSRSQGPRHDERAGKGNSNQGARHDGGDKSSREGGRREQFGEHHRVVLTEYYGQQFRSGRCPPGLAKKHNGCMPPGQARKWHTGQYLPQNVVYYSVPQTLVLQFGPPPSGHRYVRVGSDILLIAIGSRMIVDAIQDMRG